MMSNDVLKYATEILAKHECNKHSYWGVDGEEVIRDLKEAYPKGMKYPYVDVANAIREISRPKPIVREPWRVVYDMGHTVDGYGCESFEEAKDSALETLINWEMDCMSEWRDGKPNTDQKYDWDYMINNCSVEVRKYNPDTDEYEEYWSPSYEDDEQVGWVEWKKLKKMLSASKKKTS